MASELPEGVPKVLVTAACLVIVTAGLKVAGPILVPMMFAAFMAVLTAPIVLWLGRRRVPFAVSIPLVVALVLVLLGAFAAVIAKSVDSFVAGWPGYAMRIDAIYWGNIRWLETRGVEVDWSEVGDVIDPGAVVTLVGGTLSSLADMLTNIVLVVLVLVFILLEVADLPRKLRLAIGNPGADLTRFEKISTEVKRYLIIKTYVSLAIGLAVWVLLAFLNVDFAVLWGLVAFILNFIPNVGAVISAFPPVLLSMVQYDLGTAAIVAGGYLALHMVIGNMIEPWLLGNQLGLSALVVFVSLIFWGWLWGPMGMLLAVPLTMVMKIALENSEQWRWVSILMDPPPPPQTRLTVPPLEPPGSSRSNRHRSSLGIVPPGSGLTIPPPPRTPDVEIEPPDSEK